MALASALVLAPSPALRAQGTTPLLGSPLAPSPLAVRVADLPAWVPRLSLHALAGVLDHALDRSGRSAPALLLGLGYIADDWGRLELEVMTSSTAGVWSCPALARQGCTATDDSTRLLTLLYGFRVETPTAPFSGFVGAHNGLELDGGYKVFDLLAGGKLRVGPTLAVRLEARRRWDYRFLMRAPLAGTALMIGLDLGRAVR